MLYIIKAALGGFLIQ